QSSTYCHLSFYSLETTVQNYTLPLHDALPILPDHGQGAVLRVQRQGHPVGVDQGVDRGALGGLDPVVRDAGAFGGGDHARVVGVDRKSTRLNSSHVKSRMPSSA